MSDRLSRGVIERRGRAAERRTYDTLAGAVAAAARTRAPRIEKTGPN